MFWDSLNIPRSGIIGSEKQLHYNFVRKLHTVFQSGWTSLHSLLQCTRVPFSPQHLFFADLQMKIILAGMRWYLIVILIYISLILSEVEHFFICLWAICLFSLEKCLFRSFAHFLIELFVCLVLSHMSSLHILEIKPLSNVSLANMFSHTVGSIFILLMVSLAV